LLAEHEAGAAGVALAAQEGDGIPCGVHVATVDETKVVAYYETLCLIDARSLPPVSTMEAPRSPPMAAPDTGPQTADFAHLVSRGRNCMGDWTPSPKSQATIASAGFRVEGDSDMAAAVPVQAEAMSPCALTTGSAHAYATQKHAMIELAHEVRQHRSLQRLMPFVVYAYLRGVRVVVFFVDRLVDIVAEYAPFLSGRCAKVDPPSTAILCRCMVFDYEGHTPSGCGQTSFGSRRSPRESLGHWCGHGRCCFARAPAITRALRWRPLRTEWRGLYVPAD
jgi:hypothetical protein